MDHNNTYSGIYNAYQFTTEWMWMMHKCTKHVYDDTVPEMVKISLYWKNKTVKALFKY